MNIKEIKSILENNKNNIQELINKIAQVDTNKELKIWEKVINQKDLMNQVHNVGSLNGIAKILLSLTPTDMGMEYFYRNTPDYTFYSLEIKKEEIIKEIEEEIKEKGEEKKWTLN